MRIALVVGARPNYFKAKPVLNALEARDGVEVLLVHTGQHYDDDLYRALFDQLDLRAPDVYLGEADRRLSVPEMITACSAWFAQERPAAAVVVGDVDSTAAAALAAYHAKIPVVHVEAGLRSGDRAMPEEINRIITDAVSGLLLVSDPAGVANLEREGRGGDDVQLVGNVMIDTLLERLETARAVALAPEVEAVAAAGPFALLTLHRPSNVDTAERLAFWGEALRAVCARVPVVFPIHPRTQASLARHGVEQAWREIPGLTITPPVGYLEIVQLQARATLVLTDSAGVAEESSVLDRPCLVLRTTTERPITVEQGTSVLIGRDAEALLRGVEAVLNGTWDKPGRIDLWDGQAGERVATSILRFLEA